MAVCCIVFLSCKKSKDEPQERNDLMGKWTLTTTYNNDGARTTYTDVNDPTLWVVFGAGGKFSSSVWGYKNFNQYEITTDNKILLSNSLTSETRTIPYSFTPTKLTMHINPCFEPCGEIFSPSN